MLEKIKSIDELTQIAEQARREGRKVVLAHGVFDLLHVGHKRHLDIGKKSGDILVVTITTDQHVNKGPGRPVFSEKHRAEMLAGLAAVDYVGISTYRSAEHVIEKLQPDVYMKGSEYAVEENDVTGGISSERKTVEQYGGRVVFTDDITFSSSNVTNRVLQLYPEEANRFLKDMRERVTLDDLLDPLRALKNKNCLLVGDTILDEYIYVEPLGKPSKENIIATRYREREMFCGGAIATANLVAQFCESVDLVTLLGKRESHEAFIRSALAPNVNLIPFYREGAQTTVKSRLVDPGYFQKLIEVAYLNDTLLSPNAQGKINNWVVDHIGQYDITIANDFGHGLIDQSLVEVLCSNAKFLAVNAQTNSANRGFNLVTRYPKADFVCIDEPEARLAASDRSSPIVKVITEKLSKQMHCPNFIITHGKLGCLVFTPENPVSRIPALIDEAIDTVGAGDAFFAVAAPLIGVGCDPFLAGFIGNAVGAMKIRIVGHRHYISNVEVIKYLTSLMK